MRALVTGASGLVGSHISRALVDAGHDTRALVRRSSDRRSLEGVPVELAVGDVLEPGTLTAAVEGCDVVFHAAAVFAYWGVSDVDLDRLTVEGTANVLRAASDAGVGRVVLTSSSVTCGSNARPVPRDETGRLGDPDPPAYYRAKEKQERTAVALARRLGLDLVVALPTITVGPHDQRLVPSNAVLVNYLKDPWRVTWPGGCNVVHAADVGRGHVLLAERAEPGRRYLLGSENLRWSDVHATVSELCGIDGPRVEAGHTTTLLTAAAMELMARFTGRPPASTVAQARTVGRFYWYSHAAAAALGFEPRPARAAIADALRWLVPSHHVPASVSAWLRLSPEVTSGPTPTAPDLEVRR